MKKSLKKSQTLEIVNNQQYLNFIIKNHMLIEGRKNNNFRKIVNAKIEDQKSKDKNISKDFIEITKHTNNLSQKTPPIFQPVKPTIALYSPQQYLTYEMLMEIMHFKNQLITQQLYKQRRSMGQIAYKCQKNNSRSLDKGLNSSKPRQFTERKSQKNYKGNILKFPLILKNRHKQDNKQNKEKFIKQQNNQLENIVYNDLKTNNIKVQNQNNKKNTSMLSIQTKTNQKLLEVFYHNQLQLSVKQQKYESIPQYKPPKHVFKKDKPKKKTKCLQNDDKEKNPQFKPYIAKQLTQFLQSNIKSIQLLRNKNKITSSDEKSNNRKTILLSQQNQEKQQFIDLQTQNIQKQILMSKIQKQQFLKVGEKGFQQQSNIKLLKKNSHLVYKSKSKKNIIYYQRDNQNIYQNKIKWYREFLFMMNLAHRKFDILALKQDVNLHKNQEKYRYYIGKGNNSLLIKSLLKRRFWWVAQEDQKKANFVWTQLKVNSFYQFQPKSYLQNNFDKIEIEQQKRANNKTKQIKQNKGGAYKPPLPIGSSKILTYNDQKYYQQMINNADMEKISNFTNRIKYFPQNLLQIRQEDRSQIKIHNHFEYNYFLGNKKALFYNLKQYYQLLGKNVFSIIPLSYHIKYGTSDPQYNSFIKQYNKIRTSDKNKQTNKNIWIVKPGQLSNRGNGITVIDEIYQLNNILRRKQKHSNGTQKTYIIQKYIEKPLLYYRRKFDIRHYMVVSRLYGRIRAYWYGEGYIRTSCCQYNVQQIDNHFMHLTNDAIQKNAYSYGKYEQANKVSYSQFQRYLDSTYPDKKYSFAQKIYPRMKAIGLDTFQSTYLKIDPNAYNHNFEVFGLDFMIDSNFDVWLIEVNTNPCLEINCSILNRIIPTMLEHTFRLTLDVIFPPNSHYPNSQKYLAPNNPLEKLQFQLIFDEGRDGFQISKLYENIKTVEINNIDQDDEVYENEGKQLQLEGQIQ